MFSLYGPLSPSGLRGGIVDACAARRADRKVFPSSSLRQTQSVAFRSAEKGNEYETNTMSATFSGQGGGKPPRKDGDTSAKGWSWGDSPDATAKKEAESSTKSKLLFYSPGTRNSNFILGGNPTIVGSPVPMAIPDWPGAVRIMT